MFNIQKNIAIVIGILSIAIVLSCGTNSTTNTFQTTTTNTSQVATENIEIACDSFFSTDFLTCTGVQQKIDASTKKYYLINLINDYKPMVVIYVNEIDTNQIDLYLVKLSFNLTHDSLNIPKTPCHKILSPSAYYTIDILKQKSKVANPKSISSFIQPELWIMFRL